MGAFSQVNPGDPWRPDPAERHNAITDLLNKMDGDANAAIAPPMPDQRGALIVTAAIPESGVISSGARILAYTPVVLSGGLAVQNPGDAGDAIFQIASVASTGDKYFGITQQIGYPGGTVEVCLQGLSPVIIAGSASAGEQLAAGGSGSGSSAYLSASSEGTARALMSVGSSGGVILAQLGVGGGAAPAIPEYSSYFKITMAQPVSGAAVVTVADGATGSNSIAVVNGGSTYSLPPYSETVSNGALYLLKYTPAQYGSGGAIVSDATMVISSLHQSGGSLPTLPDGGTSGAFYYQLGRVLWSSGGLPPRVVQDHTAGVAQFNWFANCYHG